MLYFWGITRHVELPIEDENENTSAAPAVVEERGLNALIIATGHSITEHYPFLTPFSFI